MTTTNYHGRPNDPDTIDYRRPILRRYDDAKAVRNATAEEIKASEQAAKHDGGAGVIVIEGQSYYVEI